MSKKINIGSEFISMTNPKNKPWLRNYYWGMKDGSGKHLHLVTSGGIISENGMIILAATWYLRDISYNVIFKNGSEFTNNTSQLLLSGIPTILKKFQHSGQSLSWDVGSLDLLVLSQRK